MVNLTKLTVAQLKDELTKRSVSYKKCKRKADYIQTLAEAIAQANQSPEETRNAQEAAHSPPQGIAVPNTVEVVNNDTGSHVPDNVNNQDDSRNNTHQPTDVVVNDNVANVNDSKVSDDRGIAEGNRQVDTMAEDSSVDEQPRARAPVDTSATESTTNTEEGKTHKPDTETLATNRRERTALHARVVPEAHRRLDAIAIGLHEAVSAREDALDLEADLDLDLDHGRGMGAEQIDEDLDPGLGLEGDPDPDPRRRANDEARPITRTDSSDKNAAKASTTTEISKTTAAAAESLREKLLASKMSKDKVNAEANGSARTSAGAKEQEKGSKEKERDSAKLEAENKLREKLLAERAAKALREKLLKGRQQRESIDDVRQESLDSVAEMINEEAEQAEEVRLEEERRLEKVREAEKKAQEKADEEQRMADEAQRKADAEQREADEKQVRADEQERSADETSSVVDEEMREEKRTGEKRGRHDDEGDAHESDKKARRNSDGDGDVDDRDDETHVEVTLKLGTCCILCQISGFERIYLLCVYTGMFDTPL
ncbi:hypothetical protein SARC_03692 [Sphaeroforma arctica JP610]|uniref:Uncharacterized protein n=1 Tax=Sphaeroforma arctica JP610 TaxID=667725 RepID=A0A0L0G590_9EUKA|nr:hypothetical protein SARC_03692 [Sphaeroforma arctica JP610]KNC84064.1 hypothetical protein SARC_03692 [Sphaeroforma arctica JP610]|eukprot:XP_014157966.1 hypothetical protein SARC_03692 [Sphaeroforma arctica JP610]